MKPEVMKRKNGLLSEVRFLATGVLAATLIGCGGGGTEDTGSNGGGGGGTADSTIDTDGDGLTDAQEAELGTNPNSTDSDGNLVSDDKEDFDSDGLTNLQEFQLNTDPGRPDTDGNLVNDGDEDADGDGLTNLQEFGVNTDPLLEDSDGDNVRDGDEDPDIDGLTNLQEFAGGTNPLEFDNPMDNDWDKDGIPNDYDPDRNGDGLDDVLGTDVEPGTALVSAPFEFCGRIDGVETGPNTDQGSFNADWDDNCRISARFRGQTPELEFPRSQYARGIQRILYCAGFGGTETDINRFADGQFGDVSDSAVRQYQSEKGLSDEPGVVGAETWNELQRELVALSTTGEFAISSTFDCGTNERQFFQNIDGSWEMAFSPGSTDRAVFTIRNASPIEGTRAD